MKRACHRVACALLLIAGLGACHNGGPDHARLTRKATSVQNFKDGKDIHLGVVWMKEQSEFLAGATLAAEEINAEGGIDGRRLVLDFVDETPHVRRHSILRSRAEGRYRNAVGESGTAIAKEVVALPHVSAVIGHSVEEAALTAMLTYQDNGVLFFSGKATDARILWTSRYYYFQLRPQDAAQAGKMADVLRERRWGKSYLIYEATRHNERLVELLKSEMAKRDVKLAGSFAVMPEAESSVGVMRRMQGALADVRAGNVDAIIVLAPPKMGGQLIRQARALGVLQPVLGTSDLDSPEFFDAVGQVEGDTFITSIYRSNSYLGRRFAERFKQRFPEHDANEWAAMAYDSVKLYAEAAITAGTTDPFLLSQALHYKLPVWHGLMGAYSFHDARSMSLKYNLRQLKMNQGHPQFVSVDDPA